MTTVDTMTVLVLDQPSSATVVGRRLPRVRGTSSSHGLLTRG